MQGDFSIMINGRAKRIFGLRAGASMLDLLLENGLAAKSTAAETFFAVKTLDGLGRAILRSMDARQTMALPMAGREIFTAEIFQDPQFRTHAVIQAIRQRKPGEPRDANSLAIRLLEIFTGDQPMDFEEMVSKASGFEQVDPAWEQALIDVVEAARRGRAASVVHHEVERAYGNESPWFIAGDPFARYLESTGPLLESFTYVDGDGRRFARASSLEELLRLRGQYPRADLVFASMPQRIQTGVDPLSGAGFFIGAGAVAEFGSTFDLGGEWRIGIGATPSTVAELVGADSLLGRSILRSFERESSNRLSLFELFSRDLLPGDIGGVLLTLNAALIVSALSGEEREVSVQEYFQSGGAASLREGELPIWLSVPKAVPAQQIRSSYRVAPAKGAGVSALSAHFGLELDQGGKIVAAIVAFGDHGRSPERLLDYEEGLLGHAWSGSEVKQQAATLRREIRTAGDSVASAEFRRAAAGALWQRFFLEHPKPGTIRDFEQSITQRMRRNATAATESIEIGPELTSTGKESAES